MAATRGKKLSLLTRRKIGLANSISLKGRKLSRLHKTSISQSRIGKPLPESTKKKMKLAQTGERNGFFGRHHTPEVRLKLRLAALARLENQGKICPNIGTNETRLLNERENLDHCKILRQYRIKELGYIVDGYCPETNTVYEVYEKKHSNRIQKDLQRETEIRNFLNCSFIILKDF